MLNVIFIARTLSLCFNCKDTPFLSILQVFFQKISRARSPRGKGAAEKKSHWLGQKFGSAIEKFGSAVERFGSAIEKFGSAVERFGSALQVFFQKVWKIRI